jgi:hypothetical protein
MDKIGSFFIHFRILAESKLEEQRLEPWGFEPQTSSMPLRRSTN